MEAHSNANSTSSSNIAGSYAGGTSHHFAGRGGFEEQNAYVDLLFESLSLRDIRGSSSRRTLLSSNILAERAILIC